MLKKASAALVTPSYRNDFPLARDLCRSVDKFFRGDFEHVLIVPKGDLGLFSPLANARRRVISKESIMRPRGFRHLPIPTRIHIPGVIDTRIKEQWYRTGAGRISGWAIQQILKLSAPEFTDAETLLFFDSDVELFRPFEAASLWREDLLGLHEHAGGAALDTHRGWHAVARKLLGIPPGIDLVSDGRNYIGHIIAWRRSNVLKLHKQIETTTGMDWRDALARNANFSEYILYGLFCRNVLREESGHYFGDLGLYNSIWTADGAINAQSLLASLTSTQVALHIQSTIQLSPAKRREIIRDVITAAEGRS